MFNQVKNKIHYQLVVAILILLMVIVSYCCWGIVFTGQMSLAKISVLISLPSTKAISKFSSMPPARLARAVIVILTQNKDADNLRPTLAQFESTFNQRFNYPYVFLNDEPFDDNFKKVMVQLLLRPNTKTTRNVSFGLVPKEHWSYPEWIDEEKAEKCRQEMQAKSIMYSDRLSYFHMCRYFSGFFHWHPLLADYDYYWRIEPRAQFTCMLDYDPFVFMMDRGIQYGYSLMMPEGMGTVPTLWNTTKRFLQQVYPTLNVNRTRRPLLKFLLDKEEEKLVRGNAGLLESIEGYTWDNSGCHFWSNFEIGSFSFFRSHLYQSYFDYLDKAGGFFYERWGDAPVHSLAIGMFLDLSQIHHFADMGYYHGSQSWCPLGKDFASKCFCNVNLENNMAHGRSEDSGCLTKFITSSTNSFII